MEFDLKTVPFSRYGSFFSLSYLQERKGIQDGLYIRNIRGGDNDIGALFRIELTHLDKEVSYKSVASPTFVRLEASEGSIEFCLAEPNVLRVHGKGVGVRLILDTKAYDHALPAEGNRWEVNSFSQEIKMMLTPRIGSLKMDAPWEDENCHYIIADFIPDKDTVQIDFALEEFLTVWKHRDYDSFEVGHKNVKREYESWLNRTLAVPKRLSKTRELASYITWSCVVNADGYLPRPAMYMSKNWMTNVWSWDHCFNAMALAKNNMKLAWDQFMLFFDRQDESGMLPDFMNDKYALWNGCKPPIHGWTLSWMMKRKDFLTKDHMNEVYEPLSRWTKWWFTYRDDDRDGVPQYNHGNDSGWDNSTIFSEGTPIESPDLCAFLILQIEVLQDIAICLGKQEDAQRWKILADETIGKMIDHFWNGEKFTATRSGHVGAVEADSLILYLPIILGKRLPADILEKVISGLKEEGRFVTEHGLATENVKSDYYVPDGYWRGPIWAPSTMLIVDGLLSAGEEEFAKELAKKFCNMAEKSGMAENFNAITGEGLRDRAFTWTSSVFLILANELYS